MSEKSFGEKRVRVEFNPSNAGNVTALKTKAAEAINILEILKTILVKILTVKLHD